MWERRRLELLLGSRVLAQWAPPNLGLSAACNKGAAVEAGPVRARRPPHRHHQPSSGERAPQRDGFGQNLRVQQLFETVAAESEKILPAEVSPAS